MIGQSEPELIGSTVALYFHIRGKNIYLDAAEYTNFELSKIVGGCYQSS
jgi:hypothetical protein